MTPAERNGVAIQRLSRGGWLLQARSLRDAGGLLLALWGRRDGDGHLLRAAYLRETRLQVCELPLPAEAPEFPSLSEVFPAADRMERAIRDLLGPAATGGDRRPWLRHGAWRAGEAPLGDGPLTPGADDASYPFVSVDGDGVHEIPVGPVHAGIIEPGHFRFSVVGEKVLRLEERLGYVHKGIERRFNELPALEAGRLAARVSGDSAAAYGWAYAMALEALCGIQAPPRALALRALLLERERIANHLGDLGALGNDAGFGFGLAQFSRLKEDLLRVNERAFGARYPMDAIVPGGIAAEPAALEALHAQSLCLETEVARLQAIYSEHAGVQDRFRGTGVVTPDLARRLGICGLAGRASALAVDLRSTLAPYPALGFSGPACEQAGDVAARVAVRFAEVHESLRLCRQILDTLPDGDIRVALPEPAVDELSIGLVEGWRGPVLLALECGPGGRIVRCHPHDPSWLNWPALEHAMIGNIVPDFPLINKSFNLSYSGHDL